MSAPSLLALALAFAPLSATRFDAQDETARPDGTTSAEAPADDRAGFRWRRFELHGRFLGRSVSEQQDGDTQSQLETENARLELRWRPSRWLRTVVEWDQAEDTHLKDAYLALRPGGLEIRAGQFKPPISPIEMDSRWDLPPSERGLLSQVLEYCYGITGRRQGVQIGRSRAGEGFWAAAGVMRASSVRGDRIGDEAFDNLAKDWGALKAVARLAWQGSRVELAGSFDLRPAEPVPGEGYQRFWTASADLTWRVRRRGGPRLWAEGYVGSSWQDANAFDGTNTRFLAGRMLVAWRLGSRKRQGLFAEPYAMGSLFDPDSSVREDLLWEASGGVQLGGFGHLRLVLEAQRRSVSRNAPLSLGLFPRDETPPRSRTRLVAQLGVAF